jgi:hypothetical protein
MTLYSDEARVQASSRGFAHGSLTPIDNPRALCQPRPHLDVRIDAVLGGRHRSLGRGVGPRVGPLRTGLPLMRNKDKPDPISPKLWQKSRPGMRNPT